LTTTHLSSIITRIQSPPRKEYTAMARFYSRFEATYQRAPGVRPTVRSFTTNSYDKILPTAHALWKRAPLVQVRDRYGRLVWSRGSWRQNKRDIEVLFER
jgi:hypothetical protein